MGRLGKSIMSAAAAGALLAVMPAAVRAQERPDAEAKPRASAETHTPFRRTVFTGNEMLMAVFNTLASDCSAQHFQTDIGCRQLLIQFMGRSGCGNEDDSFELEHFECFARQNQVTMVDRIEGTTEDADLFQTKRLFCHASTVHCRSGWMNRGLIQRDDEDLATTS